MREDITLEPRSFVWLEDYYTAFDVDDRVATPAGIVYHIHDIDVSVSLRTGSISLRKPQDAELELELDEVTYMLIVQHDPRGELRPGSLVQMRAEERDSEKRIALVEWDTPLIVPDNPKNSEKRLADWDAGRLERERIALMRREEDERLARIAAEEAEHRARIKAQREKQGREMGARLDLFWDDEDEDEEVANG